MKRLLFTLFFLAYTLGVWADNVEIDGISYSLDEAKLEATVISSSSGKYYGDIIIPCMVNYGSKTYSVTSIGNYAFYGCSGLTSVTIPNSVESIGFSAFSDCSGLTSVTIGHSVESIGDYAFSGCRGLTYINIPNSVTSIAAYAFQGCSGLTSVHITDLAAWCKISLYHEYSNPLHYAHHLFLKGEEIKDLVIPNSVTSIGNYAFYGCSGLTSITIPNSVTSIGESAFSGCSGLTSITIGNGVNSIGDYAFIGCNSLTSVNISDLESWCKISFADCQSNPLYNAHHLFLNGEEIKDLVIPNRVTSIEQFTFAGCSGLTSVTIPNSVTSIGNDAFYGCSGLTSVTIGNSVESIGSYAFYSCSGLTSVTIPNSMTSIGNNAFGCSGLTSVTIGNSVESIGSYAFYSCSDLTSVTIPSSVKNIGSLLFYKCSSLTDVYCYAKNIPEWKKSWSSFWSDYKYMLSNITLHVPISSVPAYKNTEPWSWFKDIVALTDDNNEIHYSLVDGINYFLDTNSFVAEVIHNPNKYSDSITIPKKIQIVYDGVEIEYCVTSIGEAAFKDCADLTSVTIPNSVTSIGNCAFEGCSALTSITIPSSVKNIGYLLFNNCSGLTDVYCYANNIPEEISDSGSSDLTYKNMLSNVTLHVPLSAVAAYKNAKPWSWFKDIVALNNKLKFNGDVYFVIIDGIYYYFQDSNFYEAIVSYYQNEYTGNVIIPEKIHIVVNEDEEIISRVTSIGDWAFFDCSGLTSITIPNSITSIGLGAFSQCNSLKEVHISDLKSWCNITISRGVSNPLYYAHHLFLNGEEVKDLVIPNNVTSIGSYAFYGCSGLTSVTIGNKVTTIGEYAFSGCSGLTSITIPNSVTSIGKYAFSGCGGLTSVTIPNSVTSIGDCAFCDCSGLTSVTIPNSVTSIGESAFSGCSGLTSVTIGNSVTRIGNGAFYGCSGLSSVTIGNSVTRIGNSAFYGCSGLSSVTIPNSVTSIGEMAFAGCSSLTSVTIGNSVESIGDDAFKGCNKLEDVYCYAEKFPDVDSESFELYYPDSYIYWITLHVPAQSLNLYKAHKVWGFFKEIVPLTEEEMSIDDIYLNNKTASTIYDLNGKRVTGPLSRGVYIINGKKVMIK